jgi:hypothetical protein
MYHIALLDLKWLHVVGHAFSRKLRGSCSRTSDRRLGWVLGLCQYQALIRIVNWSNRGLIGVSDLEVVGVQIVSSHPGLAESKVNFLPSLTIYTSKHEIPRHPSRCPLAKSQHVPN